MLCMGSNVKPFALPVDGLQTLAEKLGVPPNTAEWCFANRKRSSFTSLESSDDEESTDEESTDDLTDGPEMEEEVASMVSVVCVVEEEADEIPDSHK